MFSFLLELSLRKKMMDFFDCTAVIVCGLNFIWLTWFCKVETYNTIYMKKKVRVCVTDREREREHFIPQHAFGLTHHLHEQARSLLNSKELKIVKGKRKGYVNLRNAEKKMHWSNNEIKIDVDEDPLRKYDEFGVTQCLKLRLEGDFHSLANWKSPFELPTCRVQCMKRVREKKNESDDNAKLLRPNRNLKCKRKARNHKKCSPTKRQQQSSC